MRFFTILLFLGFCTCVRAPLTANGSVPPVSHPDANALIALYNATDGDNWTDNTNWLEPTCDVCTWYGVTCNSNDRVTRLDLSGNNLSGELSGDIGGLTQLEILRLANNDLSGSIPEEINDFGGLTELVLSINDLSGPIPNMGNLGRLRVFQAITNNLTGPIPTSLLNMSRLEVLLLSANNLSGPWPNFGAMTGIRQFSLTNNGFTGPLPALTQTLPDLTQLRISGSNSVSGGIPPSWLTFLPALTDLSGSSLGMSGPLPALSGWPQLDFLSLSNNDFSGCYPSGYNQLCAAGATAFFSDNDELPDGGSADFFTNEFCANGTACAPCHPDYQALVDLYNATNGAGWTNNSGWADGAAGTDCAPCDWFGVFCNGDDRVVRINLLNNGLTGNIGINSWTDLSELENLGLSLNDISGSFPQALWLLDNLEQINMQSCDLGGNFPSPGNNPTLRILDVADNNFINAAPIFGDCPELVTVNIADNNFVELGQSNLNPSDQPNLTTLLAQNNQFFELLPEELGDYPDGQITLLRLDGNNFVGCYPANYTNLCDANTSFRNNPQLPDEGSATFFATDFCDNGFLCDPGCHPDYAPLVEFYNSTNGDDWTNGTGWLEDCEVCDWQGVSCNGSGRVTHLILSSNNLSGALPQSMADLDQLLTINFSNNNIGGTLPQELGALANMRFFRIRNNSMSGTVPTTLSQWTALESFDISDNDFTGPLPIFDDSPELMEYVAANAQFSGPIPENLISSPLVDRVAVANNQLSGPPPALFGDLPLLTQLFLQGNQLTGCYPANYTGLCGDNTNFTNNPGLPDGGSDDFFENQFCVNPGVCNTLPVTWVSFTARPTAKTVELDWVTAEETDNAGFVVERSADGTAWSVLSELALTYHFVDAHPLTGESLYRIRQTDFDGTVGYSEVRRVSFTGSAVTAYPNPFSGQLTVVSGEAGEVRVTDLAGRAITQFFHRGDGAQVLKLSLPAGVYVLRFDRSGRVTRVVAR